MNQCSKCKYLFVDMSVGFEQCVRLQVFSENEYNEYCECGYLSECPYYEKDETEYF